VKVIHPVSRCAARLFTAAFVVAGLVAGAAPQAAAQTQSGFTYNGMAYASYWYNEYLETPQGPQGAAAMATAGVDYATVLVTQYQQTYTSNTIAPSSTQTPTDAAVVAAIANLKAQGIKVVLKPHVDSLDGYWRGQLEPTNEAAWFASYQTFIVHYATIAQAQGADIFVIGCELRTLSGSYNGSSTLPYWQTIIDAVRAVYSGPITYAANATGAGDEFTTVSFWDKLDMIGVDGYFPLTNHADPTLTELKNAWTNAADNVNGFNPLQALKSVQSAYGLPLIFTELGYMSTSGTNEEPYNYTHPGTYDPTEQQNCYEAFFEVFSQQTSWMKGVFWWDWSVSPPATDDLGYSPQNKPAGDATLPYWYGTAEPGFTITSAASALSFAQSQSGTSTIAVGDLGGFSGAVTLTATGLPSGVTAGWSANPVAGSSVLTLTASSTAAIGTATVTISGSSGSLTPVTPATIALTINAGPSFTLSPSSSSRSVTQGGNATDTITITGAHGFSGGVTLAATGLPSGVTAAWGTNPATSTSVLTLTASGTATTGGPVTVTITGTSGSLTASTTIALTVNAAPIAQTITFANPGAQTVGTTLTLVATASSGLAVSFASTTTSVCTVSGTTATFVSPGTCTIDATQAGNATYAAATMVPQSFAVNAAPVPGLAISALPASFTVAAGSGGTSTITVTPSGGFTGSVSLATAITSSPANAINPPTFSFGSTSPVNITGTGAGTAALTISTTASSGGGGCTAAAPERRGIPWHAVDGAALACVLLFGIPARRRRCRRMLAALVLLVAMIGGMASCGGGKTVCTPTPIVPGTTTGAYTITVTASSGTLTPATTAITLNVQ
jgi:hypothetical protein